MYSEIPLFNGKTRRRNSPGKLSRQSQQEKWRLLATCPNDLVVPPTGKLVELKKKLFPSHSRCRTFQYFDAIDRHLADKSQRQVKTFAAHASAAAIGMYLPPNAIEPIRCFPVRPEREKQALPLHSRIMHHRCAPAGPPPERQSPRPAR